MLGSLVSDNRILRARCANLALWPHAFGETLANFTRASLRALRKTLAVSHTVLLFY